MQRNVKERANAEVGKMFGFVRATFSDPVERGQFIAPILGEQRVRGTRKRKETPADIPIFLEGGTTMVMPLQEFERAMQNDGPKPTMFTPLTPKEMKALRPPLKK